MVLLISIFVNTVHVLVMFMLPVCVCIQRCVEPHWTVKQLVLPLTASCNFKKLKKPRLTSIRGIFMLSIANLQLFELFEQVCMSVTRCFAKLDVLAPLVIMDLKHHLQTGFVVSVGNNSDIFPYFALCVCFFNKPRTVGRSTQATFSHVCVCSVTVCPRETVFNGWVSRSVLGTLLKVISYSYKLLLPKIN